MENFFEQICVYKSGEQNAYTRCIREISLKNLGS